MSEWDFLVGFLMEHMIDGFELRFILALLNYGNKLAIGWNFVFRVEDDFTGF